MRNTKKWMALLLSAAMIMQSTPNCLQAASKPKLNKTKLTLQVGKKAKLSVKGGNIKKCVFRSKNKKIATVNGKGLVKARKKGNTKICVTVIWRKAKNTIKKKLWCKVIVKAQSTTSQTKVSPAVFVTEKPGVSNAPVQPAASQNPVSASPSGGRTAAPGMTAAVASENPTTTAGTEPTEKPFDTAAPKSTADGVSPTAPAATDGGAAEPGKTQKPDASKAPDVTGKPDVTRKPDIDLPFVPAETPDSSKQPDRTKVPDQTPAPTAVPTPTQLPYQSLTTGGAIRTASNVQWKKDRITSGFFEYCLDESGQNAMITGLTSEGKNQTELTIPAEIDGITVYAVKNGAISDAQVQTLTVSEGVKEMAAGAVSCCSALEKVSIPSTLQFVAEDVKDPADRKIPVFDRNYALAGVEVAADNPWYRADAHALYSKDGKNLLCWFSGSAATCAAISADVYGVEPQAFYGNYKLEKIILPDSVQEIGRDAFYGCASLKELQLPKKLSYCGERTFALCTALTELHIPEGVEDLEGRIMFCLALKKLYLPASLKVLSEDIYDSYSLEQIIVSEENPYLEADASGCYSKGKIKLLYLHHASELTEYKAPDSLREIADGVFRRSDDLETVDLGNVEKIGNYVFHSCDNLRSVTFGNKLKYIGESAFYGCKSLKEITLPDGLDTIGAFAFSECTGLNKVTFLGKVNKICNGAFGVCSSLEEFHVPEGIEYLDSILGNCKNLKKVTLSSTVRGFCYGEELDFAPFYQVWNLETIEVDADNPYLKMVGNALYTADGKTLLYYCGDTETEIYNVVTGTAVIGDGAFGGFMLEGKETALNQVHLPEGVKEIREGAFEYCRVLKEINLPDSLLTIQTRAFNDCSKLEKVTVTEHSNLQEIGTAAFQNCNLMKEAVVPGSVEKLGDCVFNFCNALQTIRYYGTKESWKKLTADAGIGVTKAQIHCRDGIISEEETDK